MKWRSEHGAITAFVSIFALTLLFCTGLVVDGGHVLTARSQAISEAEAAARAGAQAVAPPSLRDSQQPVNFEAKAAYKRANDYLKTTGHQGTVNVNGDRISVEVTIERQLSILRIAGMHSVSVHGHAEAIGVRGVSKGGD